MSVQVASVLIVCVGNICRSPVGARLLAVGLPRLRIGSAGLGALAGHGADAVMAGVAARHGLVLCGHVARDFTPELAAAHDLILVMEPGHKAEILRRGAQFSGRTMLFDHWTGGMGIADPYRKPAEFHAAVFAQLSAAAAAWCQRLGGQS